MLIVYNSKRIFFSFPSNAEVETSKFSGSSLVVNRFFSSSIFKKEDVVFLVATFCSNLLLGNPSGVAPGFYLPFPVLCRFVSVKVLLLLGPEETFSTKAVFVSSLPFRLLLSLHFWPSQIPSYSFRPMVYFKRPFYSLSSISVVLIIYHCAEEFNIASLSLRFL